MTNRIQIVGGQLPVPQYLYPTQLAGVDVDVATSHIILSPGDAIPIPAGSNTYIYDLGAYSVFQWQDPITGTWRGFASARSGTLQTDSNGVNLRVANLTGCPIGADIPNGGTGYSQGTCAITASVGGSTWQPVVGGSLSVSTINVAGAGFTVAPMVLIPAPPTPGVPATAYATLSGTSVTGVTLGAIGAGYTASTLQATIVPSPFDPNLGSITNATVTLVLNAANAGKVLAALCTNNGAPLSTISALTLTAAGGAGSGATITPQVLQTVTGSSIVAGGAGWGTATAFAKVLSVGGFSSATETIVNPQTDLTGFRVRPIEAVGTTNAGGTITAVTINDAGLFLNTPTAGIASGGTLPTTLASITLTTGSSFDTIMFQPL
jgi:hypothetical protein